MIANVNAALLLIDIQNDFLPGGALAVPDGDAVIGVANRLLDRFQRVIATQDWHPSEHGSFAANHPGKAVGDQIELNGLSQILWPIHCVQHSPGAEFAADLRHRERLQVFRKGLHVDVDSYSGFFDNGHRYATGLDEHLKASGISDLFAVGLATDYCVKFTVLDACQLGFRVHVVQDGCRAVNLQSGDDARAFAEMQRAGARLTDSEAVVHSLA